MNEVNKQHRARGNYRCTVLYSIHCELKSAPWLCGLRRWTR